MKTANISEGSVVAIIEGVYRRPHFCLIWEGVKNEQDDIYTVSFFSPATKMYCRGDYTTMKNEDFAKVLQTWLTISLPREVLEDLNFEITDVKFSQPEIKEVRTVFRYWLDGIELPGYLRDRVEHSSILNRSDSRLLWQYEAIRKINYLQRLACRWRENYDYSQYGHTPPPNIPEDLPENVV